MLSRRIFSTILNVHNRFSAQQIYAARKFCRKKESSENKPQDNVKSNHTLGDIGTKYEIFRDEDTEIFIDVEEERRKYASMLVAQEENVVDPFDGLNLNGGKTGVFDIEDLIEVLKRENAEDIFVAAVAPEFKYVDYICVVSGKSRRHMAAITQFVRRVFKQKRDSGDKVPILEGASSEDWMALDLGNIALHIFSKQARKVYDLESLWSVGPEFDKEYNKEDPIVAMLEKHSVYLGDLQPAS